MFCPVQSPARARDEITALFASHVDGMKKIYQQTVFQLGSLGPFTGITFVVYRIQVKVLPFYYFRYNYIFILYNIQPVVRINAGGDWAWREFCKQIQEI